MAEPRSIRTNNPGAMNYGPFAQRHGAIGSDGRLAIFPDMSTGYAAQEKLLGTYESKHGLNTVRGIVNRWAPPNVDNNSTGPYTQFVSSKLGVDPDQPLTPDLRPRLAEVMAHYEAGRPVPRDGSFSPSPQVTAPAPQLPGAPPMVQPATGWTPESADYAQKFGGRLMQQGMSTEPVGHWTQALARVLQSGSGAAWNQQGMEAEREGNAAVAGIYRDGVANGVPITQLAAQLMGQPFGMKAGQAMATQSLQGDEAFGRQKQMAGIQHGYSMVQQGSSQAHAGRMAELQHQLQIRLMNAKDDMEKKALLDKGRALGLIPPEGAAPPAQAPPAATGEAPMPAAPAAAARPDPYQSLVQPAIPKAQLEAEMKKRASQALLMGDPKGAAKIMNKEDDPKEYQTKDALWAERMARSEIVMRGNIGTPDQPKYNPGRAINRFWPDDGVLGMANSEQFRTYQAGAREWIAALLRKDTGAAVTETEWKLYFPTYFPQPGDSPEVQRQKLERRVAEARKLRAGSGPVFDRMNPNFDAEMGQRLREQGGASPTAPVAVTSPDEARRLPSGTPIKLPDGTIGRVP